MEETMNLNEIYELLGKWDTSQVHLTSVIESQDRIRVENVIEFKSFADDVQKIPAFVELVQALKKTALYLSSVDQITVNRNAFKEIYRLHTKLFAFVEVLRKTLGKNLGQTNEHQVVIKLTDPDDLSQMLQKLKSIQSILSQVLINDSVNGDAKIKALDIDAGKANFYVGSQAAMQLVGSISRSAVLVCQKLREGRFIYEYVQNLKVKDESLLDINSGHDKKIQILVDQETEKAQQKYFGGAKDPEQYERLKMAISRFTELLDYGNEIHPANNAPEKVRRLFPSLKLIQAAKPQIKLIPEAA
jgi:hypothetical protein